MVSTPGDLALIVDRLSCSASAEVASQFIHRQCLCPSHQIVRMSRLSEKREWRLQPLVEKLLVDKIRCVYVFGAYGWRIICCKLSTRNQNHSILGQIIYIQEFSMSSILAELHQTLVNLFVPSYSYILPHLVLKRVLDDPGEVLPSVFTNDIPDSGRQIQHSPLRHRPFYQHVHVTLRPRTYAISSTDHQPSTDQTHPLIPNTLQASRDTKSIKESRDRFVQMCSELGVRDFSDRRVEYGGGVEYG